MYIIYLECTSSYGHFVAGMNTVVLPRSVAISSQLNDVLTGMRPISGTALNGAIFYSDDSSAYSKSRSIIAMLSKDGISGQQAESILTMMTHDSSNARIGNAMAVSSNDLYLMHLPSDVLFSIPLKNFVNSAVGAVPNTWLMTFYNTVVTVADFMYRALIDKQFIPSLVATTLVIGLHKLAEIHNTVSKAVKDAVNEIVKTFNAFKDWATSEIQRIATSILDEVFGPLIDAMDSFYASVKAASEKIKQDIADFGSASNKAIQSMLSAFAGDMLLMVMALSIAINTVFYAVQGLTIGTGFLISIVVSTIAGIVIQNLMGMALGNYDSANPQDDTQGVLTDWLESIFFSSGMSQSALNTVVGYLDQFWCVIEMIPALVIAEASGWKSVRGLAVTLFSIVLGFYAIGDHDARLTALAMVLGGIAIVDTLIAGDTLVNLDKYSRNFVLVVGGFGMLWFSANLIHTVV